MQGEQSDIGAHIKHGKNALASPLCRDAVFVLFENGLDPEGFLFGNLNDMALFFYPDLGSHHRRGRFRRHRRFVFSDGRDRAAREAATGSRILNSRFTG